MFTLILSTEFAAATTPPADGAPVLPSETPMSAPAVSNDPFRFGKFEAGWVTFLPWGEEARQEKLKVNLEEPNYLGALKSEHVPYLLFQAKSSEPESPALYLIRADGKEAVHQMVHPGKILSRRSGRSEFESRAFFGDCLGKKQDVYLSIQKDRIRRRKYLQNSVLVAKPGETGLEEELITSRSRRPSLRSVLGRVRKGRCVEIAGVNRRTGKVDLSRKNSPNETN